MKCPISSSSLVHVIIDKHAKFLCVSEYLVGFSLTCHSVGLS